jgi:signal transduction histidine kinase
MARSTSSPSERGTGASIIAISSLAGLVAALAGGLVAGGEPPKLLVGAALGLVVGALGALGVIAVVDRRLPTESADGRLAAFDRMAATEPARAGAGRPAGPAAAPATQPAAVFDDAVTAAPAAEVSARTRNGGAVPVGAVAASATAISRGPGANLEALVTSIGHRYQSLADRQLAALSELADDEPENGKLALATRLARRMRRTSKTLQVLADDPDSREAAPTATIAEVIAAAIADNDEFARIDYRSLHPGQVDGDVVPDVVHLLAELLDNAVSSSRTNGTSVSVLGRRSADGYILSVVDEGSGMPTNQRNVANDRVHTPPSLAQQVPSAFGLPTVGRLAARHDISVTLLEAATDGVIAKVRLPARVMGGQPADPAARRAKDRPAFGAGGAAKDPDRVIDLTAEARPATVGTGPVKATAGTTVAPPAEGRSARPDPSGRADLARQVQRNRGNAQEAPVRNSMQPASLDRSSGRSSGSGRSPASDPKDDAEAPAKDGGPDGRG